MKGTYPNYNMYMRHGRGYMDEDPSDEEEAFKQLPPWKQQCIYNEMVKFQKELRQLRMARSLRCIIHAQQEQINPPMAGGSCPKGNGYSNSFNSHCQN